MIAGLSQRQAQEAMRLGWTHERLREVSDFLRARNVAVGRVAGRGLEVLGPSRVVLYSTSTIARLELLLEERRDTAPLTIYTDGSGTYKPDQCGAGVVVYQGKTLVSEHSEATGTGSNNTAELAAVRVALEQVPDLDRAVLVVTDSQYVINMLESERFAPGANAELVELLRAEVAWRPALRFEHVRGHQLATPQHTALEASRIAGNARADELAGAARRRALNLPPKGKPLRARMPRRLVATKRKGT